MFAESLDEDWEKDFDVEVTEQELEAAKERLKNASAAGAGTSPVTGDNGDAGKVCMLCFVSCFLLLKETYVISVQ